MQLHSPQPYAPVIIKLLQGVLYSDDPHWDRLQSYLTPIKEYFGKIGLLVQNYETEGFAYLEQPDPDPEDRTETLPRLTVRRQLSLKVTLLCVLLREQLRQFDSSDVTGRPVLSIDQLRDLLQPYLPEKNNEEKFRKEVDSLVRQGIELDFLKRLSGQDENYEIRSILKAKVDAEMLELLKQKLDKYANSPSS
jgi:uncharacterized protein with ParB-like and HNH nuclease domain